MSPRVRAFGERGFLVEPDPAGRAGTAWVLAVAERCQRLWPGAVVVPGLASVLVTRDVTAGGHGRAADELRAALAGVGTPGDQPPRPAPTAHQMRVRYDGPDLAGLAAQLDVSAPHLVARHRAATWTVAAIGFSPGFGYLTCADPLFAGIRRRADPRPRVPAGSVALAAGMCAIYPSASPGGWQVIGSTDAILFDPAADPPVLLRAGDVVRFEEIT